MPYPITVYKIMLSCPGDIDDQYKNDIRSAADLFNKTTGRNLNILLDIVDWKSDSYPESRKKGQEAINEQLVNKSDMIIALFWTRFGSPTDKYGSGTEEEIELMIKNNKNVFLYFLTKETKLNKEVLEQYNKILEFKEKYKNNNYYYEISKEDNFKDIILSNLSNYFIDIAKDNNSSFYTPSPNDMFVFCKKLIENIETIYNIWNNNKRNFSLLKLNPFTDLDIIKIDNISPSLEKEEIEALNIMINIFKKSLKREDYNFVKNNIIDICIEKYYIEYKNQVGSLPFKSALNSNFVKLYNKICSDDQKLNYISRKLDDNNNEVLILENNLIKLFDKECNIIIDGKFDNNRIFTGYMKELNQYPQDIDDNYTREGFWENGEFIEGIIHHVLCKDTENGFKEEYLDIGNGNELCFLGKDNSVNNYIDYIRRQTDASSKDTYYLVDCKFKDGKYEFLDRSIYPLWT